jgi:cation diffusion facilitator family transporter
MPSPVPQLAPLDPLDPLDAPQRIAFIGILVNALLAGCKLLAGIFGNSFALVADAVESMADIAGSAVIWGALKYGRRPPDEEHPFGHGKAEALAALAVGVLIIVAGLGIGAEAVRQIRSPQPVPAPFTLIVLVMVVLTKEGMFRIGRRAAVAAGSSAGRADAWHHRSDAITSALAFIGISIALIGGPAWAVADDWAALAAALAIVINGLLLLGEPYHELVDRNDTQIARRCAEIALSIEGIDAVERCESRKSGRLYRVIMHAEVDPAMSVKDAHDLTGNVKEAVRRELANVASVLIHVEPSGHNEEVGRGPG